MIKLEYDVDTSGVRVSFVLKDGLRAMDPGLGFESHTYPAEKGQQYRNVAQNEETLTTVAEMVQHAIQYEKDFRQ